jgi:hypothetical protein
MVLENSFFDRRRRSLVVRLRAELNGAWPTRSGGAAPREDADDKRPELRHERAATIQDDAGEDHVRLDELDRASAKIPAPKITPVQHKALS